MFGASVQRGGVPQCLGLIEAGMIKVCIYMSSCSRPEESHTKAFHAMSRPKRSNAVFAIRPL
jgi:hypothetical protein